jgi:hypothetical protein
MTPLSAFQHHRGWLVVLGAFLIQMVGFGAIYSSYAFSTEIAVSAPIMLLAGSAEAQRLSHQEALGLLGLIGAGSLTGRFNLAVAADRLGRRISFLFIRFALGLTVKANHPGGAGRRQDSV